MQTVRTFFAGQPGTGKTTALRFLWLERAPRAIVLDAVGEMAELYGRGRSAVGLDALLRELRDVSRRGKAWRVVTSLSPEEMVELAELLVPVRDARAGLAYALGGVALFSDELDTWARHNCAPPIKGLWQRGRHARLHILGACQTPSVCDRVTTGMARYIGCCQLSEPNDLAYMRRALPAVAWQQLVDLPAFHAVLYDRMKGASHLIELHRDRAPTIVRELTPQRAPAAAPIAPPRAL